MLAIGCAEVFDQSGQHPRNFFVLVLYTRRFVVAEILPPVSDRDMRSNFVGRPTRDEEVPGELSIALLSESLRNIRWYRGRCCGQLNSQIPIGAYFWPR